MGSPRPIWRWPPRCASRMPAISPWCCCGSPWICGPISPPRASWPPISWRSEQHFENALQMLAPVGDDDPLSPVIRLQRAAMAEQLGHTDEAMQRTAAHRA